MAEADNQPTLQEQEGPELTQWPQDRVLRESRILSAEILKKKRMAAERKRSELLEKSMGLRGQEVQRKMSKTQLLEISKLDHEIKALDEAIMYREASTEVVRERQMLQLKASLRGRDLTPGKQPGYRKEIKAWMKQKKIPTQADAAERLGVSLDTLKAIMRGDSKRYSEDKLKAVLEKIDVSA